MNPKTKGKVTIRDIAELVGVHHSTVSRALSPVMRDKISPEVVQKVERAAKKLGYYPNLVASSLKQNRSFAVGVLIPDLMNPVFPPMIRGIQDTAEAAGYTVITANTDDEDAKERSALAMMRGRSIEGVIVATARRNDPTVEECIQSDIPFVLVNRTVDREDVNAVVSDEDFGIRSVLDHLVALRHARIAHVAGPQHTSTGYHRAKAFTDYLHAKNLPADLVETTSKFTIEEGRRAVRSLLLRDNSLTAIIASNDLLALGCMDALHDMGVLVPEDVSVTGYDDILFLDRMHPALSTVAVPKYEMGAQATKTLLEIIGGNVSSPVVLRMQPRLMVRSSTARASRPG
ncbi:MAG: LacI family transcriptional regulator [Gammaproteobacteria bacterium]|nr:LacI family transcriptional regulator [Gammaproteobacteria bacterium]MDH5311353.1 LacI family transcriptional regulator [Gammaproteobacteria bacterium]